MTSSPTLKLGESLTWITSEDTALRDAFNKAIVELDNDGTYKTIAAKYFDVDIRGK